MKGKLHPPAWKTLLAFGIIYFVWGSTFLAIRVGVREVPPFLFAALRFLIAGVILWVCALISGERVPNRREWASVLALATLIFVFDYGLLFWAELRIPSGVAAVMMATIPAFTALSEILILRTQKFTARLGIALLVGLAGVGALMLPNLKLGGAPINAVGAIALIFASLSWSVASALNRKLPLPASKIMSSGTQMFAGGVLLALSAAGLGEFRGFRVGAVSAGAWIALAYLIVPGSIIGFTAYVWLLDHQSPTKVGTYAYVNPVVAVLAGYFLGGETLGLRTILGALCVLISVVTITTARANKRAPALTGATK